MNLKINIVVLVSLLMGTTGLSQNFYKRTALVLEVIQAVVDTKEKIDYMKYYAEKLYEEREGENKIEKSKTLQDLTTKYSRLAQILSEAPSYEEEINRKKIITVNEIICPNRATAITQAEQLKRELSQASTELANGKRKLTGMLANIPTIVDRVKWLQAYFTKHANLPILSEIYGMLFLDAIQLEQAIKKLRDAAEMKLKLAKKEEQLLETKINNLSSNIELIRNIECIRTFSNPAVQNVFEYAARDGCRWQGKFTDIRVSVKIDLTTNTILSSEISMNFNETKLNGCGYASIPDNRHSYRLTSKADKAKFITIDYGAMQGNQPKCKVRFTAKVLQGSLEGHLIIDRIDIPHDPGVNFHITRELFLLRN